MGKLIKQKEVAEELLHKLEAADPYAILAGGAPRDWFFGKEANDLDFYVHLGANTQVAEELRWKRLGLDLKRMEYQGSLLPEYKCMKHLKCIYEGAYKGQKYQVMVMNFSTFDCVVDEFGASVCMAWWKGGEVKTTDHFLLSHYKKVIFIKDNYTAKEIHITKMKERYPEYDTVTFAEWGDYKEDFAEEYNVRHIGQKLREVFNGE